MTALTIRLRVSLDALPGTRKEQAARLGVSDFRPTLMRREAVT